MFTGIIESIGHISGIRQSGTNTSFDITSPISHELKIDQSLSHNGVCLTIESISGQTHTVTAISETLQKTNLSSWTNGTAVNLERCLPLNGRIDGHWVQGHVDTTASCIEAITKNGSWEYCFSIPSEFASLVIEKGSIAINGTSLTVFDVTSTSFRVAIIPYTYQHTTIHTIVKGSSVNIEFDILGKYILRHLQLKAI